MLSIIHVTESQYYVLLVQGDVNEGLDVQVCDGTSSQCWFHPTKITSTMKPQSRNKEDNHTYMSTLHQALITSSTIPANTITSRFVFEFSPQDDHLQVVVKERLNGTSTLSILFRSQFQRHESSILSMFQSIRHIFLQQSDLLVEYKQKTTSFERNIHNYVKEIEQLTAWKESKYNELVPKMCIVLNAKKIEIQRLKDEVESLQTQLEGKGGVPPPTALEETKPATIRKKKQVAPKPKPTKKASSVDAIKAKARGRPKKVVKESESEEEEEFIEEDEEEEEDESVGEDEDAQDDRRSDSEESSSHRLKVKGKGYDVPKVTQSSSSSSGFLTQRASSLEVDSSNIMDFLSQKQPTSQTARSNSLNSNHAAEQSSNKGRESKKRTRLQSDSEDEKITRTVKISQSQSNPTGTNTEKITVKQEASSLKEAPSSSNPNVVKKKKFFEEDSDGEDDNCLNYM